MAGWINFAWAFGAGALIPVMVALSGGLGRSLGSPAWAAAILFGVALAVALPIALLTAGAAPLRQAPHAPPIEFLGGLVVAFYVFSTTILTPRIGVGPTILFAVSAQILSAAVIGHFGWLGAPRQPLDLIRTAGLALMIGGLSLSYLRRG